MFENFENKAWVNQFDVVICSLCDAECPHRGAARGCPKPFGLGLCPRLANGQRKALLHSDGTLYQVLAENAEDMLLANGGSYIVAWHVETTPTGRIQWQQGHYFMRNLENALLFFIDRAEEREAE